VQPATAGDTAAVKALSVAAVPTKCFTVKLKLVIVAVDARTAAEQAST
jgi:hypothetical protein